MADFSDQSPYQSPRYPLEPQQGSETQGKTPGIWKCYVVYCAAMALLYLCAVTMGLMLVGFANELSSEDEEPIDLRISGGIIFVLSGALMLMYCVAPFLPRRNSSWIYGLITIGIGLTSPCTVPICLPLLIFWFRPETKAFFRAQRPSLRRPPKTLS